jgi:predicted Zn-dependent protease
MITRLAPWLPLAALACVTNPATGGKQFMLVSESQEISMGREYDQQVSKTLGLYADSGVQRYIQEFGARLAAKSERPALPWTFRVVDDTVVNAFALPGGFVYVTRGILAHLNSEAQLAAVVGHEIGHVTARHSASQLTKQQLAQAGLAIGSIASPQFGQLSGLAGQALGVLFLKFSRDDESQADELGLRYMRRAGYDPREMPGVFRMLDRVSGGAGGRVPAWQATHPNPENRRQHIADAVSHITDTAGTIVGQPAYYRRLDGMIFGDDPREGYFKGVEFFHPELRFRLTFPDGWTAANQKQRVIAASPSQDGAVELTIVPQTSASAAAQTFFAAQGIFGGQPDRTPLNRLSTIQAPFGASLEAGTVYGTVIFVEYGGAVYRLLGYALETKWSAYQSAAERAMRSFAPLTDTAALNVQAARLTSFVVKQPTSIQQLAAERASPVPAATLALINQVELEEPIAAGAQLKWVVVGR